MKTSLIITSILLAVSMLGAGCVLPARQTSTVAPAPVRTPKPADVNGFGKLPSIGSAVPLGNPATRSAMAVSSIAPMPAGGSAPMMAGDAAISMIARPETIPAPPEAPGVVRYEVTATIPSWETTGDVLRTRTTSYPSSQISLLAQATGLPAQTIGSTPLATSLAFTWKDTDGYTWSYDAVQRNLSFWKQDDRVYAAAESGKTPPAMEDAALIRIAENFLAAKGLDTIPRAPAVIEKPWGGVMPATDAARMPCPVLMMDAGVKTNAAGATVSEPAVAPSTIAPGEPSPCWFPVQATVTFPALYGNRTIRDVSGWPMPAMSVTIDLNTSLVTGGYGWLNRDVDGSSYALIDRETAIKRLNEGGRNPIWPWGNGTDITVKITSADLVWMRYDSWNEKDGNATYLIPALAGTGTVEYETGTPQPYNTIVPLIADDAFEPVKPPEPMPLPVEPGGGIGGAPAETGAVEPATR